ncbi:sigma-70 family RNA polymerase sigma factor [Pseudomonas capsici]|uniref:sigma-70 family RNA polymerase sigma factor n=1 Tax=Pseudomonas capsici TaxID=2810614 RepID=UPI000E3CC50C|nr:MULTISPECIES: sigma-70 family RNA polymerase sigma factor [Pseudomonas]MBN6712448.1 sigma-70 family RNA polymerase sigma factor [Pseudomonas capsici]MBN6717815.1 sigma-70 family RNA polymerase sigma factor [Pseudomonas capsici]MBN6723134.1 sigma-70 family RNA polymerase sigma factor [Pseudomonas capsici]MBX8475593.1 sigma-70 family RNA polymerase sigma factor [Pseudomonas cichorii]MBX8611193.1 sigma-70 family RNA polymerase sigma factor [Pseudomonas cichorii]
MDSSASKLDLYLTHRSALVDYAAPIVGCRARAEDVVQEAWLRFNSRQNQDTAIDHPVGYLYRIVRNLALDLTRSIATEKRQPDGDTLLAELPATTASPEQEAVSHDQLQQVSDALAQLPERTRMAFEMHRLGGYTLQQIAAALGISVGLTHQLVHDALSHCAAWLERGNG